ncbi:hypothetical protein ACFQ3K_16955 [Brucella gallinifaecis]|uniref:Uncharacterized protein n=1 Tax=Brucella gallinifaecis TaxID=215590 RepID=A0A502BGI4_9HYPH|nr:hypothetical protein [Brucella gallinifaecis]TPF73962.1 hypothetical protein FHY56_16965 [Brucella gallinifaecis]
MCINDILEHKYFLLIFLQLKQRLVTMGSSPFNIKIDFSKPSDNVVGSGGADNVVITDEAIAEFQLNEDTFKKHLKKFSTKYHVFDYLYFKDPTPLNVCSGGNNAFAKFQRSPTTTSTCYQRADPISFDGSSEQLMVITSATWNNDTREPATFSETLKKEIAITSQTEWSAGAKLGLDQEISYEFFGLGGKTTVKVEESFGRASRNRKKITVGTTSAVSQVVQPGQTVIAELVAYQSKAKVRLFFKTAINRNSSGYLKQNDVDYCNFIPSIEMLESLKMPTEKVCYCDVECDYYSKIEIRLRNPETNNVLTAFPASFW